MKEQVYNPKIAILRMTKDGLPLIGGAGRSCYSKKLVLPKEVTGWNGLEGLAESTFRGGHHTLPQHIQITFALEGISRQFIWTFLHAHPYYNSSQQSQRYVSMGGAGFVIPPLNGQVLETYQQCLDLQLEAYQHLIELLKPSAEAAYRERFPQVKPGQVQKKAQEVARYVLPIATIANLYYTINLVTLLRLHRLCLQPDAPWEQQFVVEKMVGAVLAQEPELELFFQNPLPESGILEYHALTRFPPDEGFRAEFDNSFGGYSSRLADHSAHGPVVLAQAVRDVLGKSRTHLPDKEAIQLVLNPAENSYLGEVLNLATASKLMRTLFHVQYVFRKKISHTADSQDQRHRTVQASRPCLAETFSLEPDYIIPILVQSNAEALDLYEKTMVKIWEAVNSLLDRGVNRKFAAYLLPNAVAIRFTESGPLIHLLHKYRARLCFNAQLEIWRVSVQEVGQIRRVHPEIGRWLTPPCVQRVQAGVSPPCPEGPRFCGVQTWKTPMEEWERVI